MRIAIQGQAGSFHHQVAKRFFSQDIELVCCETFQDVFTAMKYQSADHGVVAIENTLYGTISDNYDLLFRYQFPIIGEAIEHIRQNLIGFDGTVLSDIHNVYSHPVALSQCRLWLETHLPHAEIIEHHDTAGAVADIKSKHRTKSAAIAGIQAASQYDLAILYKNIEDEPTNLTRFLILGTEPVDARSANKASLRLITSHSPGALYNALGVFARYHTNLTKLESRPLRGERFRYQFYVDILCDPATLSRIMVDLQAAGCTVTLLGHYNPARI